MSLPDEAYPSSEDTYLLIDALKEDEELLSKTIGDGGIAVEIGYVLASSALYVFEFGLTFISFVLDGRCGSGEVSKFMTGLIDKNMYFLSTDVNTVAITQTKNTLNRASSELVCADMFSCFRERSQFNVVIFNPPYVPTDETEFQRALTKRDISASWAGGRNGREVTDRFLQRVSSYLSDKGVVYLVVIDINNVQDTLEFARSQRLDGSVIAERSAGIEKLYVLRLYKILDTPGEVVR